MTRHTPLHSRHLEAGARMVDFAGWQMPLHYGSQIEEHHAVRRSAGLFDVSHMTVVDLAGDGATPFLRHLLANDVARLEAPGKALYSCMLNEEGGVIDDLIVYARDGGYRLVVNAATRDKDLEWIGRRAEGFEVEVRERDDLAMIAVQGPRARELFHGVADEAARAAAAALEPFFATEAGSHFIARTGYTGEAGYEIMLPAAEAGALWDALVAAGARPAGLGARDSLRLEAGMNLYGNDMDETTTPLVSGLGWTVAFGDGRDFIGRAALERQRAGGVPARFVGLVLEGRGVLRAGQKVVDQDGTEIGRTTSGGFSPTLGRSIALARVAPESGEHCAVEVRGRALPCRVVRPPFVRDGEIRVALD